MSDERLWVQPFAWGDYLGDTQHLTTEQHGAYLLLIGRYWMSRRPLPDDDGQLGQITGLSRSRWRRHRAVLAAFFSVAEGLWRHGRIDRDLEVVRQRRRTDRERGRKGARARWRRDARGNAPNMPEALPEPPPEHPPATARAMATRTSGGTESSPPTRPPEDSGAERGRLTVQQQAVAQVEAWFIERQIAVPDYPVLGKMLKVRRWRVADVLAALDAAGLQPPEASDEAMARLWAEIHRKNGRPRRRSPPPGATSRSRVAEALEDQQQSLPDTGRERAAAALEENDDE